MVERIPEVMMLVAVVDTCVNSGGGLGTDIQAARLGEQCRY